MDGYRFSLAGADLIALGSGALFWPAQEALCVSDLHLGKSERMARRGGAVLPPYDTRATLSKLGDDLARSGARTVVCLGDSFDDLKAADSLGEEERIWLTQLQAGRRWIWIEGNHDPGPLDLGGSHVADWRVPPLVFRHIAQSGACGEISGHYHPKVQVRLRARTLTRPAFLIDATRVILPAYGQYTGGLSSRSTVLQGVMAPDAYAVLTGPKAHAVPL